MPGEVLTRASTAAYTIALAIGPHRSTIIAGSTAGGGCSAGCSTTWDRTARYGVRQVGSHRRDLLARGLHLWPRRGRLPLSWRPNARQRQSGGS